MWTLFLLSMVMQKWSMVKLEFENRITKSVTIIRHPKEFFPKTGSLQLSCEAIGQPSPRVTWHYSANNMLVTDNKKIGLQVLNDLGLLKINKPVEKETYEFFCNASNGIEWVASSSVKTGLAFLSNDFVSQPKSIQVLKMKDTAIISCQPPQGNPLPQIKWLRNNKMIKAKVKNQKDNAAKRFSVLFNYNALQNQSEWSLKINDLRPYDSGRYKCVAENDYGRLESRDSWLFVLDVKQNIFDMPIQRIKVKIKDTIELMCPKEINGNIHWILPNDEITNHFLLVENSRIKINGFDNRNQGYYGCYSEGKEARLLALFHMELVETEHLGTDDKMNSRKKVVIEGANVILECDVTSQKAEFYWETPQRLPIFPNDNSHQRYKISKNGNLNILNVQLTDSGKYTCNIHTSLDVTYRSIHLEVFKHQLDMYPIISLPAQNQTIPKGSDIVLSCEVIGEDIIKMFWFRGINIKLRIEKSYRISFPSKDTLKIFNAQLKDTDFYTCEAINEQGRRGSWTAFVEIVDGHNISKESRSYLLPLPPVIESPRNVQSTSIELHWSSNDSQNYPNDVLYWIEYLYFGSEIGWEVYRSDWNKNSIVIQNLKPDYWYQFLVRSKTSAGISRASVPTEYIKTKSSNGDFGISEKISSFIKIKLHNPKIAENNRTKLTWSVLRNQKDISQLIPKIQFSLNYQTLSIVKCIVDMSNENAASSESLLSLKHYCSLNTINSATLKLIEYQYGPAHSRKFKTTIDSKKVNISKAIESDDTFAHISWISENLHSFHCYNISISSKIGYDVFISNNKLILTPETVPSRPPENVKVSWILPEVSVDIKWDNPNRIYWNGMLVGIHVYMKSNESELLLKYNDTLTNKIITRVNPNINWIFQVTIINCVGESRKSEPIVLNRLSNSFVKDEVFFKEINSVFKKSWMIAILVISAIILWTMLSILTVYLCCIRSNNTQSHKLLNTKISQNEDMLTIENSAENHVYNKVNDGKEKDMFVENSVNDKGYSDNRVASQSSSGNSSSPSGFSYCNPYASTPLFESLQDNPADYRIVDKDNQHLYYLSSPIFEPNGTNKVISSPAKYFLSNKQGWMNQNQLNCQVPSNFMPLHCYAEYCKDENAMDTYYKNEQEPNTSDMGTISNLLMSTAPFSDHFSSSSKNETPSNSSVSDSSHKHHPSDKQKQNNVYKHSKNNIRRRQEPSDFDRTTEMTHLLTENNDNCQSGPREALVRVYDTPYSDSTGNSDSVK